MFRKFILSILGIAALMVSCAKEKEVGSTELKEQSPEAPFLWESANLYFLLTDRFHNGDPSNDQNFDRNLPTGPMRGFQGGDIKGITQKIQEGYFTDLGVNAIWFTPVVEQVHGGTDEGTGFTYAFHGYWTKDWTALDPNFGTMEELAELVATAHQHGIRVLLDAVINHTGPVTEQDPQWPDAWVRTSPKCAFNSYETAVTCTLVDNLPDIRTESEEEVALPEELVAKWKAEGRYEKEMQELDAFFARTGYPRAPKYYIIKWLTDYVRMFGIDGFRADTVRHIEEDVWADFKKECELAFAEWKRAYPDQVLDGNGFYMVGEVYGYEVISSGKFFDFGDLKVNYYDHGFDSMINFEFKKSANADYESLFSSYAATVNAVDSGIQVLNYATSHDDSEPFDKERNRTLETGTKLLLTPGTAQIYYGDETGRGLVIEGTQGDATLRSPMNWAEISGDTLTQGILAHWQKLGRFRRDHPSVGAGSHAMMSAQPYIFKRSFTNGDYSDQVIVGLDLAPGEKVVETGEVFADGTVLRDAYSGQEATVAEGKVKFNTPFGIVLLEAL